MLDLLFLAGSIWVKESRLWIIRLLSFKLVSRFFPLLSSYSQFQDLWRELKSPTSMQESWLIKRLPIISFQASWEGCTRGGLQQAIKLKDWLGESILISPRSTTGSGDDIFRIWKSVSDLTMKMMPPPPSPFWRSTRWIWCPAKETDLLSLSHVSTPTKISYSRINYSNSSFLAFKLLKFQ